MAEFHPAVDRQGFPGLRQRIDSGIWWFYGTRDGKPVKRSFLTRDIVEAQRLYHERYDKALAADSKITVRRAWKEFEGGKHRAGEDTIDRHATCFRMDILPGIGHLRVDKVTSRQITRVLEKAEERGLSENSRANVYAAMLAFFKWCLQGEQRYCTENPVRGISEMNIPQRKKRSQSKEGLVVNMDEVDRIAEAAAALTRNNINGDIVGAQMRVIVLLLPLLGLRLSEMLALQLPDWNPMVRSQSDDCYGELLVERQLRRKRDVTDTATWFKAFKGEETTIGDKVRTITLGAFAAGVLQSYIDAGISAGWLQRGGLLFPTAKQTPRQASFVSRKIKEAVEAAGIGRSITAHFFRHTYVSSAIKSYTDASELIDWDLIGDIAGHDPKVARTIYGHLEKSPAVKARTARFAPR